MSTIIRNTTTVLLFLFIGNTFVNAQESIDDWRPFMDNEDSLVVKSDTIFTYILFEDYPRLFSLQTPVVNNIFSMTYYYMSGEAYTNFSINDTSILQEGLQEKFYPDGTLMMTGNYSEGEQSGIFTFYHDNGKVRSISTWENGKQHGKLQQFYKNGYQKLETTYVNGRKTGFEKVYWSNSKIRSEANYRNNSIVGEYKVYNFDGVLGLIQTYSSKGEFLSEEYQTNYNEALSTRTDYSNDRVVRYQIFDNEESIFLNNVEVIQSNALNGRTRGLFLIQYFNFTLDGVYSGKEIKKTEDFMAKHTFKNADFSIENYKVKKKKGVVYIDFKGLVDKLYVLEGKQIIIGDQCYTYLVGVDVDNSAVPTEAKDLLLNSFELNKRN